MCDNQFRLNAGPTFWAPGWEARLCRSRFECRPIARIFKEGHDFERHRSVSTVRRKLSASDLLAMPMTPVKELFPLIDKEKYLLNAPHGIYNVGLNDTATEIATHLDKDIVPFPTTTDTGHQYRPPNPSLANSPSLRKMKTSAFSFGTSVNKEGENDDRIIINVMQTNPNKRKHNRYPDVRRQVTPVIFVKGSTRPPFTTDDLDTRLAYVWLGCRMEYHFISKQFAIDLEMHGDVPPAMERTSDAKLVAKICLLPGNVQKQTVDIASTSDGILSRQHAYFRGFTKDELQKMEVGIKLYRQRGFIKRRKLIHEWSIPLRVSSMIESSIAWKKIICVE